MNIFAFFILLLATVVCSVAEPNRISVLFGWSTAILWFYSTMKLEKIVLEKNKVIDTFLYKEFVWISVEDELPEIPEDKYAISVLAVKFDNGDNSYDVSEVLYFKDGFKELVYSKEGTYWEFCFDEVTHWQYLPEPTKCKGISK